MFQNMWYFIYDYVFDPWYIAIILKKFKQLTVTWIPFTL